MKGFFLPRSLFSAPPLSHASSKSFPPSPRVHATKSASIVSGAELTGLGLICTKKRSPQKVSAFFGFAPFFPPRERCLELQVSSSSYNKVDTGANTMKAIKWLCFLTGSKKDDFSEAKASSSRSNTTTSRDSSFLKSENVSATSIDSLPRSGPSPFLLQKRQTLRIFDFSELKDATNNFSPTLYIGEGGFGRVYRGLIKSSEDRQKKDEIAVKQLITRGSQGHKEWLTEVNVLGIVEHPNLVKLIGYCAEDDERGLQRLLVYEFMPNRSVADHLSVRSSKTLPWPLRLRIALDAARGLTYLHEEMEFQIIFRDFKTSNILLDEHWNTKLSDFGLAREGPAEGASHVSTAVVGTIGYAAPEYVQTGHLTVKNDIWSYGVVLYELITGRRPVDWNLPKGEQKLLEWVKPYLSKPRKFRNIMDPKLSGQYNLNSAQELAEVANRCLVKQPKDRPKMSEVLQMVKSIVERADLHVAQHSSASNDSRAAAVGEVRKNRQRARK